MVERTSYCHSSSTLRVGTEVRKDWKLYAQPPMMTGVPETRYRPGFRPVNATLPFSSVVPVKSGVSDAVRAFIASDAAAQSAAFFSALMSIFRVLYGLRRANRASASMSAT